MTLLAGFKTLLLLRSGRNDICVATMMANRSQPGTERVIGPFANTTLIRTRIDADLTFQEALDRVRDAVLEAYARQELPFDIIAARLRKKTVWIQHHSFNSISSSKLRFAGRSSCMMWRSDRLAIGKGKSAVMPIDRTWLRMTPQGDHRRGLLAYAGIRTTCSSQ